MTDPIVSEASRVLLISKFLNFVNGKLEFILNKAIKRMLTDMDRTIMYVEGSYKYMERLSPEEANRQLQLIKGIITKVDSLYLDLCKSNFLQDQSLKKKCSHLMKALYKAESKLHKVVYQKTEPLDDRLIKEGVAKMNALNIAELV